MNDKSYKKTKLTPEILKGLGFNTVEDKDMPNGFCNRMDLINGELIESDNQTQTEVIYFNENQQVTYRYKEDVQQLIKLMK